MNSRLKFQSFPASPHRNFGSLRWLASALLLVLTALPLMAVPDFSMVGWATQGKGTTGGEGGRVVTVTTPEELVDCMAREGEPLIIQVKGTIDMRRKFPGHKKNGRYLVASDKSIVGLGRDAEIRGAELRLRDVRNVIIRNLTLSDSSDTAIAVSAGSKNVWIDHNEIYGAPDGLIDVTTGADLVTVSWNRLHSAVRMGLSGRVNDRDTDRGATRVTYHNNWFNDLDIRSPYAAWGKHHIFNNYYTDINNYGIGIAAGARIVLENNFFDGARRAYFVRDRDHGWDKDPGTMDDDGTIYKNISIDDQTIPGRSAGWHPSNEYSYTNDDASDVPQVVINYAGVGVIDPLEGSDEGEKIEKPKEREWASADVGGLIAFYPLNEGEGATAADRSGFGTPLDLTLSENVTWLDGYGVSLPGGEGRLYSEESAEKLAEQIAATGEMSVEIWAKSTEPDQPKTGVHPARIVTFSGDNANRNFMLGQGGEGFSGPDLSFRLRTTGSFGDANGLPNITVKDAMTDEVSHYVVSFDQGRVSVFRDGELKYTTKREGELVNWDPSYSLVLGNDVTGSRGWVGELHMVAIYDMALTEEDVRDLYEENYPDRAAAAVN